MNLGSLYLSVRAKTDKYERDLKNAKTVTGKAAAHMKKELSKISLPSLGVATAAFTASIGLMGKEVIALGRNFESTMKTVQAWSGATGKELDDLEKIARKMGATTEHTATEAAGALKFLAAAGFTAKQSIAALPGTLNLATAGQVALAEATDITTDVLTAFGLNVKELSRVNDAFITTTSNSNTNVLMLGESMKMVAPTAKLMGLSVEQTSALLGALANAGVKAEMAGSGLNMALLRSQKAAKMLGMELNSSLIDVLKRMKEEQWNAIKIGEAFGARQVKTAGILMDNMDTYDRLTKKIHENVGATEKLAAIIRDSLDTDIKTLVSTIQDEMLTLFDKYKDDMRDIVQLTTDWIRANDGLIQQKTHETIDKIKDSVTSLVNVYNSLPDGVVGAVGVGILGRILFGSTPAGAFIASAYLLGEYLDKLFRGKVVTDAALLETNISRIQESIDLLNESLSKMGHQSWLFTDEKNKKIADAEYLLKQLQERLNSLNAAAIENDFNAISNEVGGLNNSVVVLRDSWIVYKKEIVAVTKLTKEQLAAIEAQKKAIEAINDMWNKLTMSEQTYAELKLKEEFDARAKAVGEYSEKLKTMYGIQQKILEQKFMEPSEIHDSWDTVEERQKKDAEAIAILYDSWAQAEEDQTKIQEEELKARTDATKKALEEQAKKYEHMYNEVHDIMSDFWESALDGQMKSWDDFMDHIFDTFKKTFAQILAQASTNIVMNVVFGGSGGSSSGGSGVVGKIAGKIGDKLSSTIFGDGSIGGGDWSMGALGRVFSGKTAPGLMAGDGAFGSAAVGSNAWTSMISGIGGVGVIAAIGAIATNVLGRMMADKPQFGISGMSKEAWKSGTGSFDREINPYEIAMENMYDDFKSSLYDYRVFASDFDNEPEIRNTLFNYFDTVFANIDKAISTNINDVLKDYQHLGVSFQVTDKMNFEQAFSGLSNAVFSELLGSMLLGVLPNQGSVEKTISTIVGSKYVTAGSQAAKNIPQPGTREFYDSAGFSSPDKGSGSDLYLYTEPVYEDITHQVSAVADIFNTEFFEAIMPEGGSTWDAFISFADTVKKTTDFMEKFDDRVNNLGLSSVEAYQQIALVTGVLMGLEEGVASITQLPFITALDAIVLSWEDLIEVLKEANATISDVAEAESARNIALGSSLTSISADSIASMLSSGGDIAGFMANAINNLMISQYVNTIMESTITPYLDAIGQAYIDSGNDIQVVIGMLNGLDLKGITTAFTAFTDTLVDTKKEINSWTVNGITYGLNNLPPGTAPVDDTAAVTAVAGQAGVITGMIATMSDTVKNIIWSSDQLKIQDIASQGEQIVSFFGDIYDEVVLSGNPDFIAGAKALKDGVDIIVTTLTSVQALDMFKGHLQTIGGMKAGIFGLEDEFSAMAIGSKYDADLSTTGKQAAFVKSLIGMSATEFITATEYFGVSVDEAAGDITTLANIVKKTSNAFEGIKSTINDTIKSLEQQFGMGSNTSLTNLMKEFNKAAGDAMSSNSLIAIAGADKLPGLSNQILAKALAEAPTSYEYQKVYAKIIRTLQNVEDAADDQVDALSLTDQTLGEQLTELENINNAIDLTNKSIKLLLSESTFVTAYSAFNQIWNNGAVFDNLNSTLISLTGTLSALGLSISTTGTGIPPLSPYVGTQYEQYIDPTSPSYQPDLNPMTGQYENQSKVVSGASEASLLAKWSNNGVNSAEWISSAMDQVQAMSFAEKESLATTLGTDVPSFLQDINQMELYGYAEGGISSGPMSGYMAKLHGTEAIIPLNGQDIPLVIKNDYSSGILSEIKGLRAELTTSNAANSLRIKKIKQILDRVTNGGVTFAVETV